MGGVASMGVVISNRGSETSVGVCLSVGVTSMGGDTSVIVVTCLWGVREIHHWGV